MIYAVSHDELFIEITTSITAILIALIGAWVTIAKLNRNVTNVSKSLGEVHVLVNSRLSEALERIETLKAEIADLKPETTSPDESGP